MTVAMTALEFLVSFLQAYVFAVLTCMYLNDALHPAHYQPSRRRIIHPPGNRLRSFQRSSIMEAEAAKFIGAGIACLGMGGAGIGLGNIFGNYLSGALRNPSAADGQFGRLIFGFAVTEALGIFSLLVALLLLFAV
jgi:F-type H+-transporting ATPase subunit c